MAPNNRNHSKFMQEYIDFLGEVLRNNTYTPFNIKTLQDYADPEELLAELEAKGLPCGDVGKLEMLDSKSSWHITVRQSRVALFRKICPWQIISSGSEQEEVDDLETSRTAEESV